MAGNKYGGNWVDCEDRLPEEFAEGTGTRSDEVEVLLSNEEISSDWLINGKWVVYCKKNGGAYPIKWRNK